MAYDPYRFDVTCAVDARRLYAEPHTWQEIQEEVWKPTMALLNDLADARPASLLCANSSAFEQSLGITIPRAEVDVVLEDDRTLVYLGMVLARQPAFEDWELLCQLAATKEMRAWLQARGPQTIRRSSHGCVIPASDEVLSPGACTRAVANYWQSIGVALDTVPITWLPDTVTVPLYELVSDTVRSQVKEYSREDIERVIELEGF